MITETTIHSLLIFDLLKSTKDYSNFPVIPAWLTLSKIQEALTLKLNIKELETAISTLLQQKLIVQQEDSYAYFDEDNCSY